MFPDFLVATTKNNDIGKAFRNLVLSREGEPRHRILSGAEGYQGGNLFVGIFPDGRWMLSATGPEAEMPWAALTGLDHTDDLSIARLDLQMTIRVQDADYVISEMQPHARYKATRIIPVNGKGTTLYVGAPASDKRLRVYNKSAQLGKDDALAELLRVELQLRNARADYALAVARGHNEQEFFFWWRETCCFMAPSLDRVLPRANIAHIRLPPENKEKGYRDWFERAVVPALQRAQLCEDWESIRSMLLRVLIGEEEKKRPWG
jgi:hypothetical protein